MNKEFMSEKYDGIQARLHNSKLISRNGSPISAPKWWLDRCPKLDLIIGELWLGYGTDSNDAQKLLGDSQDAPEWAQATLMAFGGSEITDEQAYRHSTVVIRVHQIEVRSAEGILRFYDQVVERGGEGVVIRTKGGSITKLKPVEDAEAEVIGYTRGSSAQSELVNRMRLCGNPVPEIQGSISSLLVKGVNGPCKGAEFALGAGLSNKDRDNPPKIGELVKYKYSGVTKLNRPKCATYRGRRDERTLMMDVTLPQQ